MNHYEEEKDERGTEHLHICISKTEKKAIQESAAWLGQSVSDYCRQVRLGLVKGTRNRGLERDWSQSQQGPRYLFRNV